MAVIRHSGPQRADFGHWLIRGMIPLLHVTHTHTQAELKTSELGVGGGAGQKGINKDLEEGEEFAGEVSGFSCFCLVKGRAHGGGSQAGLPSGMP